MTTKKIRIISDIHSNYQRYYQLLKGCEYSVQLGDMSYNYEPLKNLSLNHRFIEGNHGSWDIVHTIPNYLGRYGYTELNGIDFFFVSGGFSIDWKERKKMKSVWGKTWFENEQLNRIEQDECLEWYSKIKPDLMLTHEAPRSIVHHFSNPEIIKSFGYDPETFTTETSELLDRMLKVHRPKKMFFGHFHCDWEKEINGTVFRCIKELGYYDYEN